MTFRIFYWSNISLLAKALQERPEEWTGGTLVQRGIKDSVNEMLRENRDNAGTYSYKMSYINSHGEETFIVNNQPEIDIEKETKL